MIIRQIKRSSMVKVFVLLGLNTLFLLSGVTLGAAEDYPTKPIIVNVGYPPGGSAGISAQIFADGAKQYLPNPQPILVNFKPGAGTAVAADYVLKQPADGYNLYWFQIDLIDKLAKDGQQMSIKLEDFIQIGTFVLTPFVAPVSKEKCPFEQIEDFIDYAKKHPGELTYGSTGIGSSSHVVAEMLQMRCGVKLTQVPFVGSAPSTAALLGGHITTSFPTLGSVLSHIQPGGGLRLLGVFTRERLPDLPDIPTCLEQGYDLEHSVWYSVAVPKGTPPAILKILQESLKKTADDPQVKADISRLGYIPLNWGPEETKKKAKEEFDLSIEIFKKVGLL